MKNHKKVSKEEMCKILKISKRKATWMLQNNIIPCENRGTATHTYIIYLEDIVAYQNKNNQQKRDEIPIGIFNYKAAKISIGKELYIKLTNDKEERFMLYLERQLEVIPDSFDIDDCANIIGYHRGTVLRHITKGYLKAFKMRHQYIIPKAKLIDYLTTQEAFNIQRKSNWHKNMILEFIESEKEIE